MTPAVTPTVTLAETQSYPWALSHSNLDGSLIQLGGPWCYKQRKHTQMPDRGDWDRKGWNCWSICPLLTASAASPVAGMSLWWLQTGHGSIVYRVKYLLFLLPMQGASSSLLANTGYLTYSFSITRASVLRIRVPLLYRNNVFCLKCDWGKNTFKNVVS